MFAGSAKGIRCRSFQSLPLEGKVSAQLTDEVSHQILHYAKVVLLLMPKVTKSIGGSDSPEPPKRAKDSRPLQPLVRNCFLSFCCLCRSEMLYGKNLIQLVIDA